MKRFFLIALALLTVGCGQPDKDGHAGHDHPVTGPTAEGHDGHAHGPGEGHGEEAEKEEGFVTLTERQLKEIQLEVTAAGVAGALQGGLRTGKIEPDPDRRVVVSPQVGGTIKHLPVIVGSRVRRGDLLAVLESPEISVLKGEYHSAEVERDLAAKELDNKRHLLRLGDEIKRDVEEAGLEVAKAKAARDGVIARLESARLSHQRLVALRTEGIASAQQVEQAHAELKALEAELQEAKTSLEIASQHLQREKRVADSRLREKAETFPAEANLARSQESIKHAQQRLLQLGANPADDEGSITLVSPIDGQVVERPVTRGQAVSSGESIAVLIDPSEVWAWIDLLRSDLASVQVGDTVTVRLVSDPDIKATGEISHIDSRMTTDTQTVRARVALRESAGKFRVGSFINATLSQEHSGEPTLPQGAVVEVEGQTVVYRVDGSGYRRTPVEIVSSDANTVSVRGLPEGSQVVVRGAPDLKALDLSDTIGGHSH